MASRIPSASILRSLKSLPPTEEMMQETPRVQESLGKINISPSQVAFIVDQYLCANNFSQTRATFRMEASSLFAGSPLNQVSKTSLNLGKILADYISLRGQKLILDQERSAMIQEKYRVQKLLDDMQNAVNTYNTFQRPIPINVSVTNAPSPAFHQPTVCSKNPSGEYTGTTAYVQNTNTYNVQSNKRTNTEAVDEPTIAKRPRGRPPGKKNQVQGVKTLPLLRTQSLVANSATTQVPTNSSTLEIHLGTGTNQLFQPSATCNDPHCHAVISNTDKEMTYKDSHRNSYTDKKNKRELDHASCIPESLENSIPSEVSTHKETQNGRSHIDLDLDTEYWSNFSLKDMGILDEDFFDHPPSIHSEGDA